MKNKGVRYLTQGAVIAALYVALSYLSIEIYPFSFRLSEALTVLPWCVPASVPGLFIGCVLSNLIAGCNILDVVFGSLTTLAAAFLTYSLRKIKWLAPIPPIILNSAILPLIFVYIYKAEEGLPFFIATVGIGELVSCGICGTILTFIIQKYGKHFGFDNIK